MRGTVLHGPRDIRFEDREAPKIIEPTDAIVRISLTCVCGSDLWPYRGLQPINGPTPMGHEYCGTVEEVGGAVKSVKPGQFVIGSFATSDNADTGAKAFDWPQWQGPDRNAVSKETGLLQEWPKGGPPLAWKVKGLGGGYSAPSVAAGRIFGMSNRGNEEYAWALNEKDGNDLWATRLGEAYRQTRMQQGAEGPGCTPTIDGDLAYVEGRGGDLACLKVADGKVVWRKSLPADFGGSVPMWAYRESPLIDGDKVIVTPGGRQATLAALNKKTGEVIWKAQVPGGDAAAYSSVIAIDAGGQRQYVQFLKGGVVGVAAKDGKFLWRYDHPAAARNGINITTPLYHDGEVFASAAYGAGAGLVKLSKDDKGGVKAEEVYYTRDMQNHHGGLILLDGYLYGASGGNEGGRLYCLDFKTGKVVWDERKVSKGSVAFADGRLYYRQEDGTMLLIEPSPKGYLERGRFEQPDRSRQPDWAHPVIANGKLYLRDQDVLLCYDVKAK
jgi:outer membrane protein assembly factor BamB